MADRRIRSSHTAAPFVAARPKRVPQQYGDGRAAVTRSETVNDRKVSPSTRRVYRTSRRLCHVAKLSVGASITDSLVSAFQLYWAAREYTTNLRRRGADLLRTPRLVPPKS